MGLMERWGVTGKKEVGLILLTFICTGTTVMLLKPFLKELTGLGEIEPKWLGSLIYFVGVLPLYMLLLVAYGGLFGQYTFFRNRVLRNIGLGGKSTKDQSGVQK